MNIETTDQLESPVFASELVNYAKLDSDDPMIETVLLSATSAVFSFLKQDLMTRTWKLIYRDWPSVGAPYYNQIYRRGYSLRHCIELPYTNLVSIDSVLLGGEASTDYLVNAGKPYMIEFDSFAIVSVYVPRSHHNRVTDWLRYVCCAFAETCLVRYFDCV